MTDTPNQKDPITKNPAMNVIPSAPQPVRKSLVPERRIRHTISTGLIWMLVATASLGLGAVGAMAQDAAPAAVAAAPAPAAPDAASPAKDKTFLEVLKNGGPAVWVCLLLSVLVMGFTIEGFAKLRFDKLAPPVQLARLRELIGYGSYQEAWQYCQEHRSFLCTVVGNGLERIGRGAEAVEHSLEEVSSQQAVLLRTNTNYLSLVGVVAPMIGLTGTVIGMIRAFASLGASGIGDPSGLAAAIGEVLTSTASGLIVAIPGFVFYYVFKSKALTAVMLADAAIYRLFENMPYEHLSGAVVGNLSEVPPAEAA